MGEIFLSGVFFSLIAFVIIAFFMISKISSLIESNQKLNKDIKDINERIDSNSDKITAITNNILSAKDDKLNLIEFPKSLDNKMNDFIKVIVNSSKRTYEIINNEQRASLDDIKTIMSTFEDTIKSKSKELKVYKEGYDYIKNKNILDEIFELISSLKSYSDSLKDNKDLKSKEMIQAAIDKLSIILSNNNIQEFSIEPGTSINDNLECEVIDTKEHSDSSQINTIVRTIDCGYKILLDDSSTRVIKKATVIVYR
jgi:methionyl-tRNA synthetase